MNLDKLVLVLLAVWSLLYGLFSVTNIDVVWGKPLMGFAALLLGIVCIEVNKLKNSTPRFDELPFSVM